jgi:N-acetylglucosamine-6-sulfatase
MGIAGTIRRPRRRLALAGALLLAAAVALGSAGAPSPAGGAKGKSSKRMNVVVILTDDQEAGTVRSYLQDMPHTNALLAARGAVFNRSYANYPLCCPSRATFLTGLYMHNSGVRSNSGPEGGYQGYVRKHGRANLAVWLDRRGYLTGWVGKFMNGYGDGRRPANVPPGWDSWDAFAGRSKTNSKGAYYGYVLNSNGKERMRGRSPRDYATDLYTEKALRFLRRGDARRKRTGKPFFLSVGYYAPHSGEPHVTGNRCQGSAEPARRHFRAFGGQALPMPPSFNEANIGDKPPLPQIDRDRQLGPDGIASIQRDWRCRREALLSVDQGVRDIVSTLKRRGELGRTLIVFTTDNGYMQGEHRIRSGKVLAYEESARLPLIIRGPGIPPRQIDTLTVNADLAPTILDAVDVRKPAAARFDGLPLLPLARGNAPGLARNAILIESNNYAAIRTDRYKWVEHADGSRELYDLASDPFECRNQQGDPEYAAVRAVLAQALGALRACARETCRGATVAVPPVPVGTPPASC